MRTTIQRARAVALLVVLMMATNLAAAGAHPPDDPPTYDTPPSCGDGAAPERVAVLAVTVNNSFPGGCNHEVVTSSVALGFAVDLLSNAQWTAMSTEDFSEYRALVIADDDCSASEPELAAAAGNAATWAAAATGNVIAIGTDEALHTGGGRGENLMAGGIAFATSDHHRTGAYVSLGCVYDYYSPANTPTPVPVLAGFGSFEVQRPAALTGGNSCFNDAHIVASHPALASVTDASLSNWHCSVHEAFVGWPLDFEVLAIAENIGDDVYTATDGTVGSPYIVARGVQVISDITLTPETADRFVGDNHTVTATVAEDEVPVVGTEVAFEVIDGPHAGTTDTATTDDAGTARFTYSGLAVGTDLIQATFVDSRGRTQRSNRVTATFTVRPKSKTVLTLEPAVLKAAPGFNVWLVQAHGRLATTGGAPVVGRTVSFEAGGTPVCQAKTNSKGVARCEGDVTGRLNTVLGLGYEGSFAGDSQYVGSSDAAGIVVVGPLSIS